MNFKKIGKYIWEMLKKIGKYMWKIYTAKVEDGIFLDSYYVLNLMVWLTYTCSILFCMGLIDLLKLNRHFLLIIYPYVLIMIGKHFKKGKERRNNTLIITLLLSTYPLIFILLDFLKLEIHFQDFGFALWGLLIIIWFLFLFIAVFLTGLLPWDLRIKPKKWKTGRDKRYRFIKKQLKSMSMLFLVFILMYFLTFLFDKTFLNIFGVVTSLFSAILSKEGLAFLSMVNIDDVEEETKRTIDRRLYWFKFLYFLFLIAMTCIINIETPTFLQNISFLEELPYNFKKFFVFMLFIIFYIFGYIFFVSKFQKFLLKKKKPLYVRCQSEIERSDIFDLEDLKQLQKITNETVEKLQVEKPQSDKTTKPKF